VSYIINEKLISKNRSYKTLNAKGTVLHETATPGASDENEFNYFNNGAGGRSVSVHAFVDYDSITQTVPWNEQAWHAGGTANRNYIGIELCNYNDAAKFEEIWERAIWLFAYVHVNVIKVTEINKDTLMSHAEVSAKWKETNHQDPIAYFANYGKTVDMFRAEVQEAINIMIGKPIVPPIVQPTVNNEVLKLQQILNKLHIHDGKGNSLVEDGILGNRTKEAVKRLQSICRLDVDGIAGQQTWNAINTILTKPLLKVGSTGIAVRYLQHRVGSIIDGDFGNATKASVIRYQGANGLGLDGKVGPNTWNKLIS
jgi:hypothetical protein